MWVNKTTNLQVIRYTIPIIKEYFFSMRIAPFKDTVVIIRVHVQIMGENVPLKQYFKVQFVFINSVYGYNSYTYIFS